MSLEKRSYLAVCKNFQLQANSNYNRDIENAVQCCVSPAFASSSLGNNKHSGILIFALPNQLEHYK